MSGIDGLCSVLISLVDQLASLYEQDDQRRALLFKGLSNLVSGILNRLSWIRIRIFLWGWFQRYFVCVLFWIANNRKSHFISETSFVQTTHLAFIFTVSIASVVLQVFICNTNRTTEVLLCTQYTVPSLIWKVFSVTVSVELEPNPFKKWSRVELEVRYLTIFLQIDTLQPSAVPCWGWGWSRARSSGTTWRVSGPSTASSF